MSCQDIKSPDGPVVVASVKPAMQRRFWSAVDLKRLEELYPHLSTRKVAQALNRTVQSVYNMATTRGLHKTAEFFASDESGILKKGQTRPEMVKTQFSKGHVPANKGLRRPGWAPGRMKETQFKAGCRTGIAAKNWRPVGTILADGEGYLRIKVREPLPGEAYGFGNAKAWPLYNRYLWEQHRGPIPPGHLVVFKDRNRSNCVLENLELITLAENARRNSMWTNYPRELAEAIQLNGALKRRIRRQGGEEQDQRSSGSSV